MNPVLKLHREIMKESRKHRGWYTVYNQRDLKSLRSVRENNRPVNETEEEP